MKAWIGVDLDGTLAKYDGWDPDNNGIGEPIPAMVERVKKWLADGRVVKIVTARVGFKGDHHRLGVAFMTEMIQDWTEEHIGARLEVTCEKDYAMLELWDDRAVRVMPNTGEPCCEHHRIKPSYDKII